MHGYTSAVHSCMCTYAICSYLSAALNMPQAAWDLSSGGQEERKWRSSFIMERMFVADTRARDSSNARLDGWTKNTVYKSIPTGPYLLLLRVILTISPKKSFLGVLLLSSQFGMLNSLCTFRPGHCFSSVGLVRGEISHASLLWQWLWCKPCLSTCWSWASSGGHRAQGRFMLSLPDPVLLCAVTLTDQ